jgi:hypothetical protein
MILDSTGILAEQGFKFNCLVLILGNVFGLGYWIKVMNRVFQDGLNKIEVHVIGHWKL